MRCSPGWAIAARRRCRCWRNVSSPRGLPLLAVVVLLQEAGLTPVAWLWLGVNLLLALPVLLDWRQARRLQAQQA